METSGISRRSNLSACSVYGRNRNHGLCPSDEEAFPYGTQGHLWGPYLTPGCHRRSTQTAKHLEQTPATSHILSLMLCPLGFVEIPLRRCHFFPISRRIHTSTLKERGKKKSSRISILFSFVEVCLRHPECVLSTFACLMLDVASMGCPTKITGGTLIEIEG